MGHKKGGDHSKSNLRQKVQVFSIRGGFPATGRKIYKFFLLAAASQLRGIKKAEITLRAISAKIYKFFLLAAASQPRGIKKGGNHSESNLRQKYKFFLLAAASQLRGIKKGGDHSKEQSPPNFTSFFY